jgi:hypothetical protein
VVKYISSQPLKCRWSCSLLYLTIENVSLPKELNPSKLRKLFYIAGSRKSFPSCFVDGTDERAGRGVRDERYGVD